MPGVRKEGAVTREAKLRNADDAHCLASPDFVELLLELSVVLCCSSSSV